jgi:hypothetical protein
MVTARLVPGVWMRASAGGLCERSWIAAGQHTEPSQLPE